MDTGHRLASAAERETRRYNLALQNTTRALAGRQVLNHPTAPRSLQRLWLPILTGVRLGMRSEEPGIRGQGALTALPSQSELQGRAR